MYLSPLNSLIDTLVASIHADAAAVRERHVLRQALHAIVRQAQVEQVAQLRGNALRACGFDGFRHETPQQACRH